MSDAFDVLSVDFFDTLVTRRVAEPTDAFVLLGRRLVADGVVAVEPSVFAALRVAAEHAARGTAPGNEVTLTEIHGELARRLALGADAAEKTAGAELALERALLLPVPGAAEWLGRHRARRRRVVCLSDTYLPSAWIEERLVALGFEGLVDRVYVSCEARASKSGGGLFRHVIERERLRDARVLHVGNDRRSDGERPRAHGWEAVIVDSANLNRYEQAVAAHNASSGWTGSLLAAAMRYARLGLRAADRTDVVARDVGTGVAAPLAVAFATWTLRTAARDGCDRVFFVSRDGWRPWLAARELRALEPQTLPEIDYLYGSRAAWHRAALACGSPTAGEWLIETSPTLTGRDLLRRLTGAREAPAGALRDELDVPLGGTEEVRAVVSAALELPQVRDVLRDAHELLAAYLGRHGVTEAHRPAFVDVGWTGGSARSLDAVLGRPPEDRRFLFLALTRDAVGRAPDGSTAFALDQRGGVGAAITAGEVQLIEHVLAAPEGPVLRYERREDTVEPVLGDPPDRPLSDRILDEAVRRTAEVFRASCAVLGIPLDDVTRADLGTVALAGLYELYAHPTRGEADRLGTLRDSSDSSHVTSDELAPPLSLLDLVPTRVRRAAPLLSRRTRRAGEWRPASIRRSRGISAVLRLRTSIVRAARSTPRVGERGAFVDSADE